eukprot:TRINITY_DN8049_c0_g1_i1.p1 TRINITY_DN8049_c0_g1~~TRINITY_DN8049_c0_g1_i1.p1  ORF type:complete len:197 (-),score=20.84 TRINITY_DN8049_c0_g1_i1:22-612(-)
MCAAQVSSKHQSAGMLLTWDAKDFKLTSQLDLTSDVNSFCYNQKGNRVVAGCSDGTIKIYDLVTNKLVTSWSAHTTEVNGVKYSPDETAIYSVGSDGKLLRWSVYRQDKTVKSYNYDGAYREGKCKRVDISFDIDGKYFVIGSKNNYGMVYHVENERCLKLVGSHTNAVVCTDWHPVEKSCLTGSLDSYLCRTAFE